MPFDGTEIDTPALRRARLIDALRHLPRLHRWDFAFAGGKVGCGSAGCAVGLAHGIGLIDEPYVSTLGEALGLLPEQYLKIFDCLGPSNDYGVPTSKVTPAMVADVLEQLSR